MAVRIPPATRPSVIQLWLMGNTRDEIALKCLINKGTASNIIKQWTNMIGFNDASSMRDLSVGLRKSRISPLQRVELVRIFNIIKQLGIKYDDIYNFLNKSCIECNSQTLNTTTY